jgi:hypothetical protein
MLSACKSALTILRICKKNEHGDCKRRHINQEQLSNAAYPYKVRVPVFRSRWIEDLHRFVYRYSLTIISEHESEVGQSSTNVLVCVQIRAMRRNSANDAIGQSGYLPLFQGTVITGFWERSIGRPK